MTLSLFLTIVRVSCFFLILYSSGQDDPPDGVPGGDVLEGDIHGWQHHHLVLDVQEPAVQHLFNMWTQFQLACADQHVAC